MLLLQARKKYRRRQHEDNDMTFVVVEEFFSVGHHRPRQPTTTTMRLLSLSLLLIMFLLLFLLLLLDFDLLLRDLLDFLLLLLVLLMMMLLLLNQLVLIAVAVAVAVVDDEDGYLFDPINSRDGVTTTTTTTKRLTKMEQRSYKIKNIQNIPDDDTPVRTHQEVVCLFACCGLVFASTSTQPFVCFLVRSLLLLLLLFSVVRSQGSFRSFAVVAVLFVVYWDNGVVVFSYTIQLVKQRIILLETGLTLCSTPLLGTISIANDVDSSTPPVVPLIVVVSPATSIVVPPVVPKGTTVALLVSPATSIDDVNVGCCIFVSLKDCQTILQNIG